MPWWYKPSDLFTGWPPADKLSIVPGLISIVPIPSSNEEIRLVDDAFGKISHMVSDGSWMVRVQAAKTLVRSMKPFTSGWGKQTYKSESFFVVQGSMLQVSPHFLEQTLDKKLMSDLRVSNWTLLAIYLSLFPSIRINHPINFLSVFRGSVLPMNAPKIFLLLESSLQVGNGQMMPPRRSSTETRSTSSPRAHAALLFMAWRTRCSVRWHKLLMSRIGILLNVAFWNVSFHDVHSEVRIAAVEALCKLARSSASFAEKCLDFLVDMFNDEIEEVRLQSIHVLREISTHITLREDQLDTVLAVLEVESPTIRLIPSLFNVLSAWYLLTLLLTSRIRLVTSEKLYMS